MSERWGAAFCCFFLSALAAASPGIAEDYDRFFRVESKIERAGARPNTLEVTYTMVNNSAKRITAWEFGCGDDSRGEGGSLSKTAVDGYRVLEMYLDGREVSLDEIIEPGQKVERTFLWSSTHRTGPYAPKTCRPVLAIFEDATFEGEESFADAHFKRRAQEAIEARRTCRALEAHLDQGTTLAAAVDAVLPQAGPGTHLAGISQAIHRDSSVTPAMVLEELENDYRWALKHLPEKWQERVAKELE